MKEHNYYIEQRNKEENEMNTYRVFGYNEGQEGLDCFTLEAYSRSQALDKARSLIDFVTSIEKV